MKKCILVPLPFFLSMCDFGPAPLNLGEAPRTNPQGELTIPINVTKAFSPTGYFYNVWAPADTTFTEVDPEKWNNFLAYQSVYQHPACADRVLLDTLAKHDVTLYMSPAAFYSEFNCTQFTYAPIADDDLYGGVFWLRGNNFGNQPGVKVAGGAKYVRFWARSLSGMQTVKMGVGVYNSSSLKPWYFFSKNVDTFGDPNPSKTPLYGKRRLPNSAGIIVDSVIVADSVLNGAGIGEFIQLSSNWKLYSINLNQIYGFWLKSELDQSGNPIPYDAIPAHNLIGAFYWSIEAAHVQDSSRITSPITIRRRPALPDTVIQAKYGSATILIDGIRYE